MTYRTDTMNRLYQRARQRAMRRLVDRHLPEFAELLDEERAAEGLMPVGTSGTPARKYGLAS